MELYRHDERFGLQGWPWPRRRTRVARIEAPGRPGGVFGRHQAVPLGTPGGTTEIVLSALREEAGSGGHTFTLRPDPVITR